jgi:hypothetical protein
VIGDQPDAAPGTAQVEYLANDFRFDRIDDDRRLEGDPLPLFLTAFALRFGAVEVARRPSRTPPRTVTGPTLLTGLARCETLQCPIQNTACA